MALALAREQEHNMTVADRSRSGRLGASRVIAGFVGVVATNQWLGRTAGRLHRLGVDIRIGGQR
jgi:hypothetical protein